MFYRSMYTCDLYLKNRFWISVFVCFCLTRRDYPGHLITNLTLHLNFSSQGSISLLRRGPQSPLLQRSFCLRMSFLIIIIMITHLILTFSYLATVSKSA